MAKTDWSAIKQEYISSSISYRALAEKHKVNFTDLCKRAKKEHWVELRKKHRDKILAKSLQKSVQKEVDRYTRLLSVADKILEKIEQQVNEIDVSDRSSIKQITGALRDIKDIQSLKGTLDTEEQKARIKKLQKEAEAEEKDSEPIKIEIVGKDADDFSV